MLRFRHLLEEHELCSKILDTVNLYLGSKGIRIGTGTIVDATIIHASSSTENSIGERDPKMHQTRKGQQWYFGAKAHIGVDARERPRAFCVYFGGQCVPTCICCLTYCTGRKRRCGATEVIRGKQM